MMVPTPPAVMRVLLLSLLALALVASLTGYGISSCQRRRAVAQTDARTVRRASAKAAADSAYYFTQGRRYEVARQLDSLASHAEAIPPAGPALPAVPPRQ